MCVGGWVGGLSAVFVYRSRLAGVCLCVDAQAIVEMLFLHSGRDDVRSTFSSKISFFFFFFNLFIYWGEGLVCYRAVCRDCCGC